MSELLGELATVLIEIMMKDQSDSAIKTEKLTTALPTLFLNRALYLKTLLYVYYESGGKLTKEEKKQIKVSFKKEQNFYSDKEYKILKNIIKKSPTSREIRKFVDHHGIHLVTIETLTTTIEETCKGTRASIRALERLKVDLI